MTELEKAVRADIAQRSAALEQEKRLRAVVEASRGALMVAVPRLQGEFDRVQGARPETSSGAADRLPGWREAVLLVSFLLGIVAVSFILPSPRSGHAAAGVDAGAIWVGVLAAVSLAGLASQERVRTRSKYLGARGGNAFRVYLALGAFWALALVFMLMNWREIDEYEPTLPVIGLALVALSVVGIAVLAFSARRADRAALASEDFMRSTEQAVDPVEQWWAGVALKLGPAERGSADKSYGIALTVLEERGIIRPQDARRLRRKKPPVVWAGDAS